MIFLFAFFGFFFVLFLKMYLITKLFAFIRAGFSFRRMREESEWVDECMRIEEAEKKRSNEKRTEDYLLRRKQRLGY